jgi:hypothetical protein
MELNHTKMVIGQIFRLIGLKDSKGKRGAPQICRKSSQIGFVVIGEETFGEIQFTVDNDARVEPVVTNPRPPQVFRADPPEVLETKEYVDSVVERRKALQQKGAKTTAPKMRASRVQPTG